MKKNILLLAVLLITVCCFSYNAEAQVIPYKPRKSQIALATYKTPETYIKINYGQPLKNERNIFGGTVVPYGKVWRTGANEATEITTTSDIKIGGKLLKAGTYSLYTIPQADKWTIIINKDLGAWGDYEYDEKKDVLRFDVPVQSTNETYEAFTIKIQESKPNPEIQMMWEKTMVRIPIEVK
jgi:hypothetical protein